MKKYKKQAKIALAAALATSSLVNATTTMFAQEQEEVSTSQEVSNTKLKENNVKDTVLEAIEEESKEEQVEETVKEEVATEQEETTVEEVEDVTTESKDEVKEEVKPEEVVEGLDIATNFPDAVFQKYIKENFDKDGDGKLSQEEIENVVEIDIYGYTKNASTPALGDVKSLEGIEHFTNLLSLNCSYTGITELDLQGNKKLLYLNMSGTRVTSLYIRQSKNLLGIDAEYTRLSGIDISENTELLYLNLWSSKVNYLNVSNNPNLLYLDAGSSKISSLDVSNNTQLEVLGVGYTNVKNLDITKNGSLEVLDVRGTGITSLDLSQNANLTTLYLEDTAIAGLDMTNNPNISELESNRLAYLNIGTDSSLTSALNSEITLYGVGESFSLQEKFPGIDLSKVTVTSGANFDAQTGVVSGYSYDTPIQYTYACGTNKEGNPITLNVSLQLDKKGATSIRLLEDLTQLYTGQPVNPQIEVNGSTGAVTYEWYQIESLGATGTAIRLDSAPSEVGDYAVIIKVAADENYASAELHQEFSILKNTPYNVDVPAAGGTITNPDGSIIEVNPGDQVLTNGFLEGDSDGNMRFPYGGKVIKADGTEILIVPGAVFNPRQVADNNGTIEDGENVEGVTGVQTGDATQAGVWAMLMSLAASIAYIFKRRKDNI
ncbi:MAG: hypothetical protein K2L08_05920 [Erysipelotrichaceae bacterium]|nr:hypothetical protein [Erysipelotrichaceae bacterium]